ncbi:MAG: hypothetical protein NW223_23190 [Hyphomicrobiaceae bacterium]|nr:hypothetical protein [Hyphomicrobiaceae bacterium]
MRNGLNLAAAALVALLAAPPAAQAFDDTLPGWAPWRRHYATEGDYVAPRGYVLRKHARGDEVVYCRRWSWREYCRPYRLGGYFKKNPDFRRLPWYR